MIFPSFPATSKLLFPLYFLFFFPRRDCILANAASSNGSSSSIATPYRAPREANGLVPPRFLFRIAAMRSAWLDGAAFFLFVVVVFDFFLAILLLLLLLLLAADCLTFDLVGLAFFTVLFLFFALGCLTLTFADLDLLLLSRRLIPLSESSDSVMVSSAVSAATAAAAEPSSSSSSICSSASSLACFFLAASSFFWIFFLLLAIASGKS
mmetsp:Transcript_8898/g.24066  ORF Transcript_8898/g.24066 Transcript_8898/m.24066 type:complete len:209 (-) Transcript_8898:139-765(-)